MTANIACYLSFNCVDIEMSRNNIETCWKDATAKLLHYDNAVLDFTLSTSGYTTWFTARGAIRIAHYDVTDDVITRKL